MDHTTLRRLGNKPRVHPNGFLQLDLSANERLHIWPEVPFKTVSVDTPMHDHTFSFTSQVLLGALRHTVYVPTANPDGIYRLYRTFPYRAQDRETPFALMDDLRYDLVLKEQIVIPAPRTYYFAAFEFHSSDPIGLTATLIRTEPFDKTKQARVAVRHDQTPQLFDRSQFDEEILWELIRRVFP